MSSEKQHTSTSNLIPSIEMASVLQNYYAERQIPCPPPHRPGTSDTLPPDYSDALHLNAITPSSSSSHHSDDLPRYDAGSHDGFLASSASGVISTAPGFNSTRKFQIETNGHPLIALPCPPKPIPIPVYAVSGNGGVENLAYTSLRDTRSSSNSCILVHAQDNSPACITSYRFGPSKLPKMHLLPPSAASFTPITTSEDVASALASPLLSHLEPIEVTSDGYTTRSQTLRTPLGTFRWRYGTKTERREARASSLLIFERITTVALPGGKKQEERRRRVAQLVRSDETRTEGSTRHTAGNGGRLEIDLGEWLDTKDEAKEVECLVVASCLVMLKKEVDRRRLHQTVVLMAGVAG